MTNCLKTNGEQLYLFVIVSTNDIEPLIRISTWKKCIEMFESATTEMDNDRFLAHLIKKDITENVYAKATMLCNEKGWGNDFFKYITIEPAFTTL